MYALLSAAVACTGTHILIRGSDSLTALFANSRPLFVIKYWG